MAWAEQYQTHRRKCQHCGAMFAAPPRFKQKTCSRRCNLLMRGAALTEMSRKGGQVRSDQMRLRFEAAMRSLGASEAVIELASRYARSKGVSMHAKGRRCGYRAGWAEACGERKAS